MFKFIFFSIFMTMSGLVQASGFSNLEIEELNNDANNSQKAEVVIIINEGDRTQANPEGQTLSLYNSGEFVDIYDVSTASNSIKTPTVGKKYIAQTPHGFYRPKKVYNEYSSYTFYGASMKYAIFFNNGIAIHASEHLKQLGTRASGGCIRLEESAAEIVNASILSTGSTSDQMASEDFCNSKGENCHERSLYLNRVKLPNISYKTGSNTSQKIWTYDTLIVVKPGN